MGHVTGHKRERRGAADWYRSIEQVNIDRIEQEMHAMATTRTRKTTTQPTLKTLREMTLDELQAAKAQVVSDLQDTSTDAQREALHGQLTLINQWSEHAQKVQAMTTKTETTTPKKARKTTKAQAEPLVVMPTEALIAHADTLISTLHEQVLAELAQAAGEEITAIRQELVSRGAIESTIEQAAETAQDESVPQADEKIEAPSNYASSSIVATQT